MNKLILLIAYFSFFKAFAYNGQPKQASFILAGEIQQVLLPNLKEENFKRSNALLTKKMGDVSQWRCRITLRPKVYPSIKFIKSGVEYQLKKDIIKAMSEFNSAKEIALQLCSIPFEEIFGHKQFSGPNFNFRNTKYKKSVQLGLTTKPSLLINKRMNPLVIESRY